MQSAQQQQYQQQQNKEYQQNNQNLFRLPSIQDTKSLQQFYVDIINQFLFNTSTPYLQKYPQIDHYMEIIEAQQLVQLLCYQIVKKSAKTKQQLQNIFIQGNIQISQQISKPLYKAIKYKIQDIFTQVIKKQIHIGSAYLVSYDWKIINVFSHSFNTKKNRVLIKLMLIIARQGQNQSTIHLQMTSSELNNFLNSLKQIKKKLKN